MTRQKTYVRRTQEPRFLTPHLRHTQYAELVELKRCVADEAVRQGPLSILDIGVGRGRLIGELGSIPEIWRCVRRYTGIDHDPVELSKARSLIAGGDLERSVELLLLDARQLEGIGASYDLIWATYFTAGNFRPDIDARHASSTDAIQVLLSDGNPAFDHVFSTAYKMLRPEGLLILGSTYIDNDATRCRQEDFYRKCGMTIITGPTHSFTATKEGFWSERFSEGRLRQYLSWAPTKRMRIIPLDTYEFARMVIVGAAP
jgi:SAM-dependent methyltransferase